MIRGKKNFLPPHPLVMGFGLLFRLDESSLASHLNERRVRGEDEALQEIQEEPLKEQDDSGSDEEIISEGETSKELEPVPVSPNDNAEASNLKDPHDENSSDKDITTQLEALMDKALGLGPAKLSNKNSGLDDNKSTLEEVDDVEEKKAAVREKPHVSKAERRKLKKGQNRNEITSESHENEVGDKPVPSGSQQDKVKENLKTASTKLSRGQKAKLKKIKEKYAEQDEEEREIRMALLASAGKALKKDKDSHDQDSVAEKPTKTVSGQDDSLKVCYKCKKIGHLSRDCQENSSEADQAHSLNANGANSEDLTSETNKSSSEMAKIDIDEDGIHEIGEEEKLKLNDLDYLTGNPLPSDILLYAVPVCGPYNALQTYKYRVKITPGTAKKGKAAKTAMNLFTHMPEVTNREKELMKACTDPELVAAIVGNAKITAPGLTQLKQKQKKGKKSSKQN